MNRGILNEKDLIKHLNGKRYCELNENLKKFIKFIFDYVNDYDFIYAGKINNLYKADIFVRVRDNEKYISVKIGSENSVHVEKLESFISFLENNYVNKSIINYLKLYHYGDDSLDGKGEYRFSAEESKIKYRSEIFKFNKYINHNNLLIALIDRFLFLGTNDKNKNVDFIYYGDVNYGIWASRMEIINYFIKNKCHHMRTIHFSSLTYQNWCRNINRNTNSELRRNYIQIKWFSIVSDLQKIRNKEI